MRTRRYRVAGLTSLRWRIRFRVSVLLNISPRIGARKLMTPHLFRSPLFCAALVILSAEFLVAPTSASDQSKTNVRTPERTPVAPAPQRREDNKKPPDPTKYSYEFTQPNFVIRHIQIQHDAQGRGKIKFERK